MPTLPIDRLSKFLLLLSSDKDGEVLAAASALQRCLKANGNDLHDLVDALKAPAAPIAFDASSPRHQVIADKILSIDDAFVRKRGRHCLREHELNFVQQMRERIGKPTAKQWDWLEGLHDRIVGLKP